jgi:hypothetical protein
MHHLPLARLLPRLLLYLDPPSPSEIPPVHLSFKHAQEGRFTRLILLAHVP